MCAGSSIGSTEELETTGPRSSESRMLRMLCDFRRKVGRFRVVVLDFADILSDALFHIGAE